MSPLPTINNKESAVREMNPELQGHENKLVLTANAVNQPHPDMDSIIFLNRKKNQKSFGWDYFHIVMSVHPGFAYDLGETWKKPQEFSICNCCGENFNAGIRIDGTPVL